MKDITKIASRLLGWVPPTDAILAALRYAGSPATSYLGTVDEAESVDMSGKVEIQDQGELGSCVSQAVCQVIHSEMEPSAEFPSRLWAYQLALAAQGTAGQDVGTSLAVCFDSMAAHGFPRERYWPYDVAGLAQAPGPTAWHWAHDQRSLGRVNYHPLVGNIPSQVRQALSAGHLVAFGTRVDDSFRSNDGVSGWTLNPPPIGETVGGHALVICGYRPSGIDDARDYLIANSWGAGWGDGGFCWISEAYLTAPYSADFWFCSAAPAYSDEAQS